MKSWEKLGLLTGIGVWLITVVLLYSWFTGSSKPPQVRSEPVSGNSMVMNHEGTMLYTANGDANTVSVLDTKTLHVTAEYQVGKEPRQLALSNDEKKLFVTSRYTNSLETIDLAARKVIKSTPVGIEPYGTVTSPEGSVLYVSNERSSTISIIDAISGNLLTSVQVEDRPRALSLTSDGRTLYVVHYLSGIISEIDTNSKSVVRTIQLAPSPDLENHKKSQGMPNTLEQIRISPDGKTAWVSHLLTNVDTPVNFEETIFPAISVIDLEKGEEILKERKELFGAINVKNVSSETQIVANPSDIIFSNDGSKAFSLMAGSEDLVVFDLARGGKASQILRHLPGNLPISEVLSPKSDKLYVMNAMSHDLAVIETGLNTDYAEAKVKGATIPLISRDPLSPLVREGKTIFYSANSDEYPVTKKNWMSCASCHAGGEVNGLTLQTAKGPRNVPSNVLAMHTGLFMWDGSRDDFFDYILTIQGEMGGLEGIDPSKPLPEKAEKLLNALKAYMEAPDSFPVPQSPYKKEDGSLTEEAHLGKALFEGKANCIKCHATDVFTDSAKAIHGNGQLSTDNTSYLYDVGSGTEADHGSSGDARAQFLNPRAPNLYDVPTLRGVWATAPYLHDGSAATLRDVLTSRNTALKHGTTSKLNDQEIDQLVAYMKSLD